MRSPSVYGQSSVRLRSPGICAGSFSVVNCTYFAREVGFSRRTRSPSGKPIHGTTIDQASTQRSR